MGQMITVTGLVLAAYPQGDYDKRIILLTRERGKITAFARGARRQNSPLLAVCNSFVFGEFSVYEGRTSYNLMQAKASNYFHELSGDFEGACYGFYFCELAEYYTREANDELQMLKLLYQSLRALCKPSIPNELIRYIYELKAMTYSGECPQTFEQFSDWNLNPSTEYALQYVVAASVEKLYTFLLTEEVFAEFARVVTWLRKHYVEHRFKSLEILETCL